MNKEVLFQEATATMNDDSQWKEWSVLVLYTLCESEIISLQEKKAWAGLVFDGQRKAYEILRGYVQGGDINTVRQEFTRILGN